MAEDVHDEEIVKDDCQVVGEDDGLTAEDVLEDEFNTLLEEIEQHLVDTDQKPNSPEQTDAKSQLPPKESGKRKLPEVKPSQMKVAEELLEIIRRSQSYITADRYKYFEMFVIAPKFLSLERQTVDRLQAFINQKLENENFLRDLQSQESSKKVSVRILRNVAGEKQNSKFDNLRERIIMEKSTLFYIVHDEAHYNARKDSKVDTLINHPEIANAENLVLLQVTATPYSLVTGNSRIKKTNRFNMAEHDVGTYFGINSYVEETRKVDEQRVLEQNGNDDLLPGTYSKDESVELSKRLKSYIEKKYNQKEQKSKKSQLKESKKKKIRKFKIDDMVRYSSSLLQYMAAILHKSDLDFSTFDPRSEDSPFGDHFLYHFKNNSSKTTRMLSNIDEKRDGKGHMILVRIMIGGDGVLFTKTLKRLRDLVGLKDSFSILLDIDINKKERKMYEKQFLPRLRKWNKNPDFLPWTYEDLLDLPVILVVVEKGKMGITYPRSLRYYDLTMRYSSMSEERTESEGSDKSLNETSNVTRGALVQDFGRACRYRNDDGYPLPTVLVGPQLAWRLKKTGERRRGIFTLKPDYNDYMRKSKDKKITSKLPEDDQDLKVYSSWEAGEKHFDFNNNEQCDNRYLLSADPQMGKTGAFLHLGYLLWKEVGRPDHTSPDMDRVQLVELEVDECEEDDLDVLVPAYREIDPDNQHKYPNFSHIQSLALQPPQRSKTYGDPNDEDVLNWYREGNTEPYHSERKPGNKTLRRKKFVQPTEEYPGMSCSTEPTRIYSEFAARPLEVSSEFNPLDLESTRTQNYEEFFIKSIGGRLLLNKKTFQNKWKTFFTYPRLREDLKFPPILIPSCGRQSSALLDLRHAMEGRTDYVQVVIIRESEERDYLQHLLSDINIDIFVMDSSTKETVGAARWNAKKLGEIITVAGPRSNRSQFCFVMDDNIISWKAVTLINDPHPPIEDVEPSDERSQRTDISLLSVLEYCSNENIKKHQLDSFSIIGFSIGSHKNINNMRLAFGRQHLFAATFLNLENKKLGRIEYNPLAWAMEDIDFNKRAHEAEPSRVLVKCRRFLAQKKRLNHGGVVASSSVGFENQVVELSDEEPDVCGSSPWIKPFSELKNEFKENLKENNLDDLSVEKSFSDWSYKMYHPGPRTREEHELIKKICEIFHSKGTELKENMTDIVATIQELENNLENRNDEGENTTIIETPGTASTPQSVAISPSTAQSSVNTNSIAEAKASVTTSANSACEIEQEMKPGSSMIPTGTVQPSVSSPGTSSESAPNQSGKRKALSSMSRKGSTENFSSPTPPKKSKITEYFKLKKDS